MNKITKEQLAGLLSGHEYGDEISKEFERAAKASGLVVLFGASDDLAEFRGAINDEASCYDGGTIRVDAKGPLLDREQIDDDDELKDFFKRDKKAKSIEALWCKESDYSWTYQTAIPHATFEIVESERPYCRGIVFNLSDLK